MTRVTYSVRGVESAVQMLQGIENRSKAMQPVFERARDELAVANMQNFFSRGANVGGWTPRANEEGYRWPIMRRTGNLFRSLTTLRGPANQIGPSTAQFGTDIEYARFHQRGTRKMPMRKVVFEPAWLAGEVADNAAKWMIRGLLP